MTGIWSRVSTYLGEAIVAVGAMHTAAAATTYGDAWRSIRDEGFWASVEPAGAGPKGEALWFAAAGVSYLVTGLLVRSHLRATGTLPMSFAAGMTAVAIGICVAMPASGAWMALACGLWSVMVAASGSNTGAGAPAAAKPGLRPEDLVV